MISKFTCNEFGKWSGKFVFSFWDIVLSKSRKKGLLFAHDNIFGEQTVRSFLGSNSFVAIHYQQVINIK